MIKHTNTSDARINDNPLKNVALNYNNNQNQKTKTQQIFINSYK